MYKRVRMTYSWKDFVYRASWLWQCGNNRWMLWNRTGRSCWKSWAPQSCIQDSWKEQGGLQAVQTKSAEVSDTGHRGGREGGRDGSSVGTQQILKVSTLEVQAEGCLWQAGMCKGNGQVWEWKVGLLSDLWRRNLWACGILSPGTATPVRVTYAVQA